LLPELLGKVVFSLLQLSCILAIGLMLALSLPWPATRDKNLINNKGEGRRG
jgi:predicted glycoside hydrolase/deacetylase ChbG (UPF0249 family)